MKKTILSLAMFGAFTGAAMAQSNVQLYGIIDMGVEHLTYDNTSVNRLGSGVQSGSRIGLKGSEDLGGGLSAIFQAETGFCANGNSPSVYNHTFDPTQGAQAQAGGSYCTSGSTFMGRTSMVGLKGNFGEVVAGRVYTDYFTNAATVDPFGAGLTGSITNIDTGALNYVRASQVLAYVSPSFGGLQGVAAYAFGGQSTGNANGQGYNLSLKYSNGPIFAGVGYLHHNATPAAGSLITDGYDTNKLTQVFGSYDFGVAKISGLYAEEKYGTNQPVQGPDNQVWMLGATVPVGPGAILASYSQIKNKNLANSAAKQIAVGYTYSLSKRTNLYTSYARINNDTNVDQYVGDATVAGSGTVGGASASGFALGIRHQF
ncbi:MAG: porin [Proteobacteria bacterium]|nr:porin [Pseudomonadota bacterium]